MNVELKQMVQINRNSKIHTGIQNAYTNGSRRMGNGHEIKLVFVTTDVQKH